MSPGQCKTNFPRTERKIRIHNSNRKNFLGLGNFSHLIASFAGGVASLGSRKSKRRFTFLAFCRVLFSTLYRLLITLSTSYAYCKTLRRLWLEEFWRHLSSTSFSFWRFIFIPFICALSLLWMNLVTADGVVNVFSHKASQTVECLRKCIKNYTFTKNFLLVLLLKEMNFI